MIIHNKLKQVRRYCTSVVFGFTKLNEHSLLCYFVGEMLLHGGKIKNEGRARIVDRKTRQKERCDNYELIKLNLEVIRRIREVLYEEGRMKRTRLALKANVQYDRLLKYVRWLETIGAIQLISDGESTYISMTEKGKEILVNF